MKKELQSGQVLLLSIIVVTLVLVNSLVIISGSLIYAQNANYSVQSTEAINLAEAGIDKAITSLNATGGSYNGESETVLGQGSYSIVVTTVSSNSKQIQSTGYIPSKSDAKVKRMVTILVSKGVGAAFNYGIQTGNGGLVMSPNSRVNGSVYSNGNIIMQNNARITGDAYVAGGVQPSADQSSDCMDENCTDYIFGKTVSGQDRLSVAQSFIPSTTNVINKVSVKIKKTNSPSDVTVRVLPDDDGAPDNSSVLASGTLSSSIITNQYAYADVYLTSAPLLSEGVRYWIMLTANSLDNNNYWWWSADSLQSYTDGSSAWSSNWQSNHSVWTDISLDLGFRTYMGGVATSVVGNGTVYIDGDAHANTLNNLTVGKGAYYQIVEAVTAASYNPNSIDPSPVGMPLSDSNIEVWKNLAESSGVYSGDITTCPSMLSSGKYDGSFNFPNGCTVIVNSPIWVTGNINLSNNNTIRLNSSYGTSNGALISDGTVTIGNGNAVTGSGSDGSYLFLISTYNSRDDPLQQDAIIFTNKDNSGVVYSNLGSINIANNNNLTSVTGWKLLLGNNVIINYDQGLASSFFTSGPSGSYTAVKGSYQLK